MDLRLRRSWHGREFVAEASGVLILTTADVLKKSEAIAPPRADAAKPDK